MSPTWSALPISPDEDFDGAPLLRGEFVLDKGHGPVFRATLHATAQGVFEAFLNGEPVSDDVLSPGWSSYEWRLRYRSYDVTSLVRPTSVLGIALGNGWFRGRLGWSGGSAFYGDELAALAQLEIEFADGYVQTVVTDESWRAGPSAVVFNDLYDGQTIDARRESDAWLQPGFSNAAGPVCISPSSTSPPDSVHRSARPAAGGAAANRDLDVSCWQDSGRFRAEPGGVAAARVQGPAGTITLRHAEVLEHDELGTRPLRTAKATDHFILSGGEDVFEPTFTFHGFRYVEVDGWPGVSSPGRGDHRRCGLLRVARGSANSSAQMSCSTNSIATWCGARAATSSTCQPTARSGMNGSAGLVTSQSSHRLRPISSTSRTFSETGWPTSPSSSGRPTAWWATSCPTS